MAMPLFLLTDVILLVRDATMSSSSIATTALVATGRTSFAADSVVARFQTRGSPPEEAAAIPRSQNFREASATEDADRAGSRPGASRKAQQGLKAGATAT